MSKGIACDDPLPVLRGETLGQYVKRVSRTSARVERDYRPEMNETIIRLAETGKTGTRMIEGCASTATVNSHKYSVDPASCDFALPVPLLSSHGFVGDKRQQASGDLEQMRIGEVTWLALTDRGMYFRAVLDPGHGPDAAWALIARGETLACSAGNSHMRLKSVVDGVQYFRSWRLTEISVSRQGANPDACIRIFDRSSPEPQYRSVILRDAEHREAKRSWRDHWPIGGRL